jgi:hypothetical protein
MHLFDEFPELQAKIAKRTAAFEEQLMWNNEYAAWLVKQAEGKAGAKEMAEKIAAEMDALGVKKLPGFKPLNELTLPVLSKEQDRLHGAILDAAKAGELTKAESLIEEMANIQAQINVKEGGGYFSGGGVKKFVTEAEKFPGPVRAAATAGMDYNTALDQVKKLRDALDGFDKAALKAPASTDTKDLAKYIKDLAKYGDRFAKASSVIGTPPAGSAFADLSERFSKLITKARSEEVGETLKDLLVKDMEAIIGETRAAASSFERAHMELLKALRGRAAVEGLAEIAAPEIIRATNARYAFLIAREALIAQMAAAARAVGIPIQYLTGPEEEGGEGVSPPREEDENPIGDFPLPSSNNNGGSIATSRIARQPLASRHAGRVLPRRRLTPPGREDSASDTEAGGWRVGVVSGTSIDPRSTARDPGGLLPEPRPVAQTAARRQSAIRIQRQHVQVASGRSVGDLEGATSNLREDVLAVMDRLHVLWSLTNDEYAAEYPKVVGASVAGKLKPASIPNTIAGLKKNAEGHLHNAPAKAVFGISIGAPVGKGQTNAKGDILAIQNALQSKGLLGSPAFKTENDAVIAGPETVAEQDIPQTIAAIGRLKMGALSAAEALLGGATDLTADQAAAVEKALSPGVTKAAPFKDNVKGITYEQDLVARLDSLRKRWYPQSKKLLAGKKLPMAQFEDVGETAKQVTDSVFGRYATGPAFKTGTAASGANLIDQSLETPNTADLVWYLIHNQAELLPVHKRHNAITDRPAEKSIINGIIASYSSQHQAELETIDRAWPATARQGVVRIQVFEAANPKANRRMLWKSFQMLIHEYLHTVTHPNYSRISDSMSGTKRGILIEGGTSLFTDEVWKAVAPKIPTDDRLRASVEGVVEPYDASVIPQISHYDQIKDAQAIGSSVGEDNFRAAYFLGKTEYLGFKTEMPFGWVTASASQQWQVPPTGVETLADAAFATGAKLEELAALNNLAVDAQLRPGQPLLVPGVPARPGGP